MSRIEVPAEAYQAYSRGEISEHELLGLEKFAEELSEKVALTPGQQTALGLGGMALAAPVLAYAASKGTQAVESGLNAMTYSRDFNRMLAVNPQLGDAEDPQLHMAYKTLRTLNPTYSKDPLIAGTIIGGIMADRVDMNNPASAPRFDLSTANELVTGAKGLPQSPLTQAGISGAKVAPTAGMKSLQSLFNETGLGEGRS
jgi:hypothetical protein